jgi:hypothetical protein
VFGRGLATVESGDEAVGVAGEERGRVEPEAGEDLGPKDPVGARRHRLELVGTADEPVDRVGMPGYDHVLEDPGTPVVFPLADQIVALARIRNLDHKLGGTREVVAFDARLAAALGEDAKVDVGLRLREVVEHHSGVVAGLETRFSEPVMVDCTFRNFLHLSR